MKKISITRIKFLLVVFMFSYLNNTLAQPPNYPRVPEEAKLVYSDLENFVEAYSYLNSGVDTLKILNNYYFGKASTGLQEYIGRHSLTPELMRDAIRKNSAKYDKISNFVDNLNDFTPEFKNTLKKYHKIMPEAMYAPTYLLVGANRGIAQASQFGQLVTITRVIENQEKLIKLIVHELSHFQQAMTIGGQKYIALYASPNNMLGICLREGGAEFITYLVLQEITQENALAYLIKNETELKSKFIKDLKVQDNSFWLWESINQKEYPILLGYAMGYNICKFYYDKASDKRKALSEILGITQPDSFLEMSAYFSSGN